MQVPGERSLVQLEREVLGAVSAEETEENGEQGNRRACRSSVCRSMSTTPSLGVKAAFVPSSGRGADAAPWDMTGTTAADPPHSCDGGMSLAGPPQPRCIDNEDRGSAVLSGTTVALACSPSPWLLNRLLTSSSCSLSAFCLSNRCRQCSTSWFRRSSKHLLALSSEAVCSSSSLSLQLTARDRRS